MLQERLFLTPSELVERYNGKVTVRTLANWRSAGISPPFTKVGGRILYRVSDIEEWEKRRTVKSTSDYSK
jgi:DNA-binding transcriptional MerR regulator